MLDISISPRRASVKSSWTLLKVLKLPSAPPVASNRSDSALSGVRNVIIVIALHNWHREGAPNVSVFSWMGFRIGFATGQDVSAVPNPLPLGWELMGFGDLRVACFAPFLGIQDVYHLRVACFTRGSPRYASIARRSWVLWRSVGEICNH